MIDLVISPTIGHDTEGVTRRFCDCCGAAWVPQPEAMDLAPDGRPSDDPEGELIARLGSLPDVQLCYPCWCGTFEVQPCQQCGAFRSFKDLFGPAWEHSVRPCAACRSVPLDPAVAAYMDRFERAVRLVMLIRQESLAGLPCRCKVCDPGFWAK